jgi:hypothetical protein
MPTMSRTRSSPPDLAGPEEDSRRRLAELLVSAAAELSEVPPPPSPWRLLGVPARRGRLHLGPHRELVRSAGAPGEVIVLVTFGGVCWLGTEVAEAPELAGLVHSTRTTLDARGRVQLDRRVRTWLAVPDRDDFDVLFIPAEQGLIVVPLHNVDVRLAGCSRA